MIGVASAAAAYISSVGVFRHIFFPSGRRIVPLTTKGIASQYPQKALPAPFKRSVHRHGIDIILGTSRRKSTAAERTGNKMERRRNSHLINPNQENEHLFQWSVGPCFAEWRSMQHPFPLLLELLRSSRCGGAPRNQDEPMRYLYPLPGSLDDAPKATPHLISYHRPSESLRGDEPEPEGLS